MTDQLSSDLASLRIDRSEDTSRPGGGSRLLRAAIVIVVLGALGLGVWLSWPRVEGAVFKTEVTTASITLVSPVQASIKVTSTGYVVPQTRADVGAKVPGRVAKVFVKEGQVVEAGAVLAELESADVLSAIAAAESRVGTLQAQVGVALANLNEIKVQVERERRLVDKGASPAATLENLVARQKALQASVGAAQAAVRAAQMEVATLRVNLRDLTVLASISGTVIAKPAEVGELVGAATPVARIADFTSMVVESDVTEARLHMIKEGSPCEVVLDAYPTKRYRGEAVEIGKSVDRAKATVVVKVKFLDPMEGVLPDMSARVSFLSEALSEEDSKAPAKLVVPADAVVERDGNKVVFAPQDGIAKRYIVQVGGSVGSGLELLNGPKAGTRVITNPPTTLRDGQSIKQKED